MKQPPSETNFIPIQEEDQEWEWTVPDLRPNRSWYRQCLRGLKQAIKMYLEFDRPSMLLDGKANLD